jgi:hypothetical protein
MKMKRIILGIGLIVVLISMLAMTGCIRKNLSENAGPITTQSYDNTGFTGIDVGSALKLEVNYGATYSVTITAGKDLLSKIRVTQSGDILKINTEGWLFNWWWRHTTPKVTITMPALKTLKLSGASNGVISGFKSDNSFTATTSGASDLDLDVETGFFKADVSGASNIKGRLVSTGTDIILSGASDIDLTGNGGNIKLDCSGASTASLRYFTVKDADVKLTGASDGSIDASSKLDVNISGASSLNYYGDPTLGNVQTSGASDLRHKTK